MNYLLTISLIIFISVGASADMTGIWILDWQSVSASCLPSTFTIDEISQGVYNVSYSYTSDNLNFCPQNFSGDYVSSLTEVNASTNTWNDSHTAQLTYNPDISEGIITYYNSFLTDGSVALYDRNGSTIPLQTGMGPIGGVWNNPVLLNSTNASASPCCMPSSVFIEQQSGVFFPANTIYVTIDYTNSTCANGILSTSTDLYIATPLVNQLNWTGADIKFWALVNFIFDPYLSPNQLTVQYDYYNHTNTTVIDNTCFYSFEKSKPKMINGTWVPDWQNYYYNGPSTYELSIVNDSYMMSTLDYSDGVSKTGFIAVNDQNQYYDSVLNMIFEYDETTDSLLSLGSSSILLTQNGSLFSDNMYAANWTNPESLDANPLPSSCCLPAYLEVGPDHYTPDLFAMAYYFPSNYSDNEACQNIDNVIVGAYEVLMTLKSFPPSFTGLNWVDNYGSSYSFIGDEGSQQLVVSNFTGAACTFKMTLTNEPYNPSTLSSGLIGIDAIKFMIIAAVSMIFACL